MSTFFAQPYDITAQGFFFETADEWTERSAKARNNHGHRVEEFEIQFVDGDDLDAALGDAWGLNQANIVSFIEATQEWEHHSKVRLIIARECGIQFDVGTDEIDLLDVEIYGAESLRELAEQFVEDGVFGDIPDHLAGYIDYDAIARDLAYDYSETTVAGDRLIYRCG